MTEVFKARVQNGRLVLDAPTDLPEGEVVSLQRVDAAVEDQGMTDEEREDLFQALDEAMESVRPPDPDADPAEQESPPTS